MRHSPQAIKRYVSTFLRVVLLHRQGTGVIEIAFLTRSSERLVQDYLGVYEAALAVPHRKEKLEEELARVVTWQRGGIAAQEASAGGEKKRRVPR